jgi:hypothetical protein
MTTADYALIVRIFSATISLVGLGWTVSSGFIYPKGCIRVRFNVAQGVEARDQPSEANLR